MTVGVTTAYVRIETVALRAVSELVGSRNAKGVECFSGRNIATFYIIYRLTYLSVHAFTATEGCEWIPRGQLSPLEWYYLK
jgi:hypothetical protein